MLVSLLILHTASRSSPRVNILENPSFSQVYTFSDTTHYRNVAEQTVRSVYGGKEKNETQVEQVIYGHEYDRTINSVYAAAL